MGIILKYESNYDSKKFEKSQNSYQYFYQPLIVSVVIPFLIQKGKIHIALWCDCKLNERFNNNNYMEKESKNSAFSLLVSRSHVL